MAERLVYTVTTGRSGTVYLAELLRSNLPDENARVIHERTGYPNFGVHTPDASHLTTFNNVGNAAPVREFFRRKLELDLAEPRATFVEISHFLCKAGLVENLDLVSSRAEVHLLALRRDPRKIAWSFINRFDFFNTGFTWLFSLDPRYPNVIVPFEPYREFGMFGAASWYVAEMFARISYYRELVAGEMPAVRWHELSLEEIVTPGGAAALLGGIGDPACASAGAPLLPPKRNETKAEFFGDDEKKVLERIFERCWGDPDAAGREYYGSGRRLGAPGNAAGASPGTPPEGAAGGKKISYTITRGEREPNE